jgi:polysaccharide biosynthesis transport protein
MTSSNLPVYEDPGTGPDPLDIRKVISMLFARAWIIIICLILSGGVSFLYLYRAVPGYTSTARLAYQTDQIVPMDVRGLLPENEKAHLESRIRPITRELKSLEFLKRVAEVNELNKDVRFLPPGVTGDVSIENAALMLRGLVTVTAPRNDNYVDLTVEHTNPQVATDLANSILQQFIYFKDEERGSALNDAQARLVDIMTALRSEWESMEQRIEPMRETADDLSRDLVFQTGMINQLAQQQTQLTLQILALETSAKQIQECQNDPAKLQGISAIGGNADVRAYRQEILQREMDLSRLKQRFKPMHPAYIEGTNNLYAAQMKLGEAITNAVLGVMNSLETLHVQEAEIEAKFMANRALWDANFKKMQASTNSMASGEFEMHRAMLDRVMQRVKETTISADLFNNPLKIETLARVPSAPSKPNRLLVAALAVFAGLASGTVMALALGFVDTSLKSLEETEEFLNFPVLSAVPRVPELESASSQIIMNDEANFAGAESFRSLRTSISVLHKGRSFKTILFTSALPEEGKTFCALNYAVALAQQGQRTLLIEGDLRRPMVAPALTGVRDDHPGVTEYLRLSPMTPVTTAAVSMAEPGQSNGLSFAELRRKHAAGSSAPAPQVVTAEPRPEPANRPTLEEFIQKTSIENLSFLAAGAPAMDSAELLAQPHALPALIAEATRKFDRVVIDSAPLLGVSDALLLSVHVQAVCLVIRAHRTARKSVQRALEMLQRAEAPLLGVILNGLVAARSDYYSDYYHYEDYRAKGRG